MRQTRRRGAAVAPARCSPKRGVLRKPPVGGPVRAFSPTIAALMGILLKMTTCGTSDAILALSSSFANDRNATSLRSWQHRCHIAVVNRPSRSSASPELAQSHEPREKATSRAEGQTRRNPREVPLAPRTLRTPRSAANPANPANPAKRHEPAQNHEPAKGSRPANGPRIQKPRLGKRHRGTVMITFRIGVAPLSPGSYLATAQSRHAP